MAEHLLKKRLKDMGRDDVKVASAGVYAEVGMSATPDARLALIDHDVRDVEHVAQQTTRKLIDWADVILTMESHHKQRVVSEFPSAAAKVHVLHAYAGTGTDKDGVMDPWGHPVGVYKRVLAEIDRAIAKILPKI